MDTNYAGAVCLRVVGAVLGCLSPPRDQTGSLLSHWLFPADTMSATRVPMEAFVTNTYGLQHIGGCCVTTPLKC